MKTFPPSAASTDAAPNDRARDQAESTAPFSGESELEIVERRLRTLAQTADRGLEAAQAMQREVSRRTASGEDGIEELAMAFVDLSEKVCAAVAMAAKLEVRRVQLQKAADERA